MVKMQNYQQAIVLRSMFFYCLKRYILRTGWKESGDLLDRQCSICIIGYCGAHGWATADVDRISAVPDL